MFIRKKNYQSLKNKLQSINDELVFAKSKADIYKGLWKDVSVKLEKSKTDNDKAMRAIAQEAYDKGKLDMFNKMKQKIAMDGFVGYNKDADK